MKFILKIGVAIFLLASIFVSCEDDNTFTGLDINVDDIAISAVGGTHKVKVSAAENWTAVGSEPWIFVSPVNGNAFTECVISIDSTHMSQLREGNVVFSIEGKERVVKISQKGFAKEISVNNDIVELPSYATYDKQFFEIDVTTNVPFKIEFTGENASTWLSCEEYDLGLDANYRPRTTAIRFNWELNTRPAEKITEIKFVPIDPVDDDADIDIIAVSQAGAEEIIPSRRGDSLSMMAINRVLRISTADIPVGSSMVHWQKVKLWTPIDIKRAIKEEEERTAPYSPDLDRIEAIRGFEGRIRVASFFLLQTEDPIPYEVQFLDAAEEISFSSNVNHQQFNIPLGDYITKLTYLRRLTVFGYGIHSLPESMKNLKRLEYLSLAANVFDKAPVSIVNKENFPEMKVLLFTGCRRIDYTITMVSPEITDPGLGARSSLPIEWLAWDSLEYLSLSTNYYEETIPDMTGVVGVPLYTENDLAAQENPKLVGTPIVLPNCLGFSINNNRLHGDLPIWILEHPKLDYWDSENLVYPQQGIDSEGIEGGFDNVP